MKIASYNVENLFDRPKVFNENKAKSASILKDIAELNTLFEKDNYSVADKNKMIILLKNLGMEKSDNGKFALIRKIRGQLVKRPRDGSPIQIVADGRDNWIGWGELKDASVNEIAIQNTGRVIKDVNADVIAVVEAENRIVLDQFNKTIISDVGGQPYEHVMVIDGNDDRGIDVGIMTKKDFEIIEMRSHVDDLKPDGNKVYSRDCPEYCLTAPNKELIWILPNHFKSKYGGNDQSSKDKRKAQSKRTAEIYKRLVAEGNLYIAIVGDFNDTPDSNELKPLLKNTDLKDVGTHPKFSTGQFPGKGTFGLGNDDDKIDYLLLSPALYAKIRSCGLFRKGAWPGSRPKRWDIYDSITKKEHIASDHHVIWVDVDMED